MVYLTGSCHIHQMIMQYQCQLTQLLSVSGLLSIYLQFEIGPSFIFVYLFCSLKVMKMNFTYNEAIKSSENLLRAILDEDSTLNTVDISAISQILSVFKIQQGNMDRNSKIGKIKQKLLDVIVDQKDECVNYLILPKFNSISEASKAILKHIITSTWNRYVSKQAEEEKNKKYSKYFCRSDNLKQVQDFHIGLFNFFRAMFFYENHSYYRMVGNYGPMMAPMPPTPENYQNYSTINSSGMAGSYYPVSIPDNQPSNIKVEEKGVQFEEEFNRKDEPEKKNKKKGGSGQQSKSKIEKESSSLQATTKAFSSCVCRDKYSESQKYFECEQCQKKYHLRCLGIPSNATERPGIKKRCPQCYLKNSNSFYQVVGELESFWTDDRQLNKQKITIKAKKCKEIHEKKYAVQLRFMKIEGKTMFDCPSPGNRSVEKAPIKQILNEVFINSQVINKGNGQDVKIGLDCMKSSETRPEQKNPVLLFVAVNIVQQKTQEQMLNAQYEYFDDNFLDRIMATRQGPLKIEINNIDFKMIKRPARGADCQHPDVYDIEQYVNQFIDLRNDVCFVCSRRCRALKIDRKIQIQLNKIRETIKDETMYPSMIFYQKDGTFKWGTNEIKAPQKMINEREINGNQIKSNGNVMRNEQSEMDEQFSSLNGENQEMESSEDEDSQSNKKKSSKATKIKKNKD